MRDAFCILHSHQNWFRSLSIPGRIDCSHWTSMFLDVLRMFDEWHHPTTQCVDVGSFLSVEAVHQSGTAKARGVVSSRVNSTDGGPQDS